jgi:hypothetical protein
MRGRLLLALAVLHGAIVSSVWAEEKIEKYPDGTKHLVYSVNSQGQKVGAYKEFFPNGKLKIQAVYRLDKLQGPYKLLDDKGKLLLQANYRDGEFDGLRQVYVKGQLVTEEVWLNGNLLAPRSPTILAAELKAIQSAKIETVGKPPRGVTAKVQQALDDPRLQSQREAALRMLMSYRCICGLAYRDMVLDWNYIAHDEAGSILLTQINQMTHTPANPGLPEDEYRFAREGTGSSNLFSSSGPTGLVDSVNAYMDDSDPGNIKVVGHRRWCLNPSMLKTGFGGTGKFSAMWSFDGSRTNVPDYNFVAYPPRGYTPVGSFHDRYAWSVSLNPKKFRAPDKKSVEVAIYPIQFNTRAHILEKGKTPLELDYENVCQDGPGIPYCIIFRPAHFKIVAGEIYYVQITGLTDTSGGQAKVQYLVAFVKL